MKTLLIILSGACLLLAIAFYLGHKKPSEALSEPVSEGAGPVSEVEQGTAGAFGPEAKSRPRREVTEAALPTPDGTAPNTATPAAAPKTVTTLVFNQALDSLVSPQSSYQQKQQAWKQLRESGKLDQAITELEQRATANPTAAEYPAALGQACLHKAGTIQDVREQGILGLKADQNFDAALNVDPSNWEARFWKATAMSYWPPQLNKGQEVLERFVDLVKWQEGQSPQPEYAQAYVLLGDQYHKQGHADYATQTWRRGLALYPQDGALQQKLSNAQ